MAGVCAISLEGVVYNPDGYVPQFGGVRVKNVNGEYCIYNGRYAIDENGDIYDEYGIKISDGIVKFVEFDNNYSSYAISTQGVVYDLSDSKFLEKFGGAKVKKVNEEYCIYNSDENISYLIDENGDIYNEDGIKTSDINVKFSKFEWSNAISTGGSAYNYDGTKNIPGGSKLRECDSFSYIIDENGDICDKDGIKISDGNVKFSNFYRYKNLQEDCNYALSNEGVFYSEDGTETYFGGVRVKKINGQYCIFQTKDTTYVIDQNGDMYKKDGTKFAKNVFKSLNARGKGFEEGLEFVYSITEPIFIDKDNNVYWMNYDIKNIIGESGNYEIVNSGLKFKEIITNSSGDFLLTKDHKLYSLRLRSDYNEDVVGCRKIISKNVSGIVCKFETNQFFISPTGDFSMLIIPEAVKMSYN